MSGTNNITTDNMGKQLVNLTLVLSRLFNPFHTIDGTDSLVLLTLLRGFEMIFAIVMSVTILVRGTSGSSDFRKVPDPSICSSLSFPYLLLQCLKRRSLHFCWALKASSSIFKPKKSKVPLARVLEENKKLH